MEILCRVTSAGLVPMYDSDYDEKKRLREGETVLCIIKKKRNYEFHKKFFALVRLTLDNLPERLEQMLSIRNEEDMLTCFKLDLGLYRKVWHGGVSSICLGSISFDKMDELEFQAFYDKCIDLILTKYLRHTKREELLEEIDRFR